MASCVPHTIFQMKIQRFGQAHHHFPSHAPGMRHAPGPEWETASPWCWLLPWQIQPGGDWKKDLFYAGHDLSSVYRSVLQMIYPRWCLMRIDACTYRIVYYMYLMYYMFCLLYLLLYMHYIKEERPGPFCFFVRGFATCTFGTAKWKYKTVNQWPTVFQHYQNSAG